MHSMNCRYRQNCEATRYRKPKIALQPNNRIDNRAIGVFVMIETPAPQV